MSWAEVLDNRERLNAFFDRADGLDQLSLIEVTLDRQGPNLRLRANLFRFPDRRSPQWPVTANRAQIALSLGKVGAVSIRGWATTVDGRLTIRRVSSAQLEFSFHGSDVAIEGSCGLVRLDNLTAHVEGPG
jgi:hypothetical protein